jgi:hypothetical protein
MSYTRLLRWLAIFVLGFALLLVGTVLVLQRVSDGPMGPLAGGPLRSGPLVSDPVVDWSFAENHLAELELVDPPGSRTTGIMVYEGELYVPCDLGFIWRRVPNTRTRWILSVLYRFKHWHEDALRDGRVVLRIAGKRFERQAVRVTAPALLARLRGVIETAADRVFSPGLRDEPRDPEAIWFFRMDPRPEPLKDGPGAAEGSAS